MERAGRLIAKLKGPAPLTAAELALAAWPAVIGRRLARHAKAVSLHHGRLLVEVDDALWQKQLEALRGAIFQNYAQTLGAAAVREIDFRVGIPRRPPARALAPGDEAAGIADPVLRRIYLSSRRKAGA
jgi:predicted nucleic acid-binding Zn ribbon protein